MTTTIEEKSKDIDSIVYVLYFDNTSKKKAIDDFSKYNWAKPIFNRTDKYLENNFYQKALIMKDEWINKKFVGCIAYKFAAKCPGIDIGNIIAEYEDTDIDIIGLYAPINSLNIITHKGLNEILEQVLKTVLNMESRDILNIRPFFCNYWLCRPKILIEYINFVDEVIEKIDTDTTLSQKMYTNSGYVGSVRNADELTRIFGKPYYTWHPFIMERILPIFCHIKKYKIHFATKSR